MTPLRELLEDINKNITPDGVGRMEIVNQPGANDPFSLAQVHALMETINEKRDRAGLPPIDDTEMLQATRKRAATVHALQDIAARAGASLAEVTRAFECVGRATNLAGVAISETFEQIGEALEDAREEEAEADGETDRNRTPSKDGGWDYVKPKPEQGSGALSKFFWAVLASMAGTAIYILLQGGAI